jgi:hypothetical protein
MKKELLLVGAGLALLVVGLAIAIRPGKGQAQEQCQPAPAAPPAGPAAPQPEAEPNQDILVTAAQGPWMICIMSYSGEQAPLLAREMVTVLRGPSYNLPAYVFNYGAEERRKEQERIQALFQQQKQMLEQFGQEGVTKMHVRTHRIEEQCAVLVGGYRDMDEARRRLDGIRKLNPEALKNVEIQKNIPLLNKRVFCPDEKTGNVGRVNPFTVAFVARNPALPPERPAGREQEDAEALRKLNAGEDLSLFNCHKATTLMVAMFALPSPLETRGKDNSFLGKIGLGSRSQQREDPAAKPAHSLAEGLRKGNLEAYVLHTKYASIVTVGGFDGPQDPRLKLMQERLAQLSRNPSYQMIGLLPQPVPIQVPR